MFHQDQSFFVLGFSLYKYNTYKMRMEDGKIMRKCINFPTGISFSFSLVQPTEIES